MVMDPPSVSMDSYESVADIRVDPETNNLRVMDEELELPSKKGTVSSAAFTIANATMGAGLLGLPFVVNAAGLVLGIFLLLFFGVLANVTLRLLHLDTLLVNGQSYEEMGLHIFGLWGSIPVMICVIGINFGAIISYIILIGDFLTPLGEDYIGKDSILANNVFLELLVTIVVLIPLSLMRSIVDLKWISFLSLVVAYSFIGVVIYRFFYDLEEYGFDGQSFGELRYATIDMKLFQTIGTPVFAYASHTVLLPITTEMADNSYEKVATAINIANCICIVSFVICGAFGYLTFFDETDGNILNNYGDDDIVVDMIRLLMTVVICFTFPLCMVPARLSVDNLIFNTFECEMQGNCLRIQGKKDGTISDDIEVCTIRWLHFLPSGPTLLPTPVTTKDLRFVFETIFLSLLAFFLASNIPDVEVVFSFVGGTFSSCTSFVFPAIFYLKIRSIDRDVGVGRVCFAVGVAAFGVIIAILTTAATIYGAV